MKDTAKSKGFLDQGTTLASQCKHHGVGSERECILQFEDNDIGMDVLRLEIYQGFFSQTLGQDLRILVVFLEPQAHLFQGYQTCSTANVSGRATASHEVKIATFV